MISEVDETELERERPSAAPVSYTHLDVYKRQGLHDQRPELLPALFFLSFALLVITASLTRVVICLLYTSS